MPRKKHHKKCSDFDVSITWWLEDTIKNIMCRTGTSVVVTKDSKQRDGLI